jgi:hypothetical protein
LEVSHYMANVTADIIAHTAFGSSYEKGRKIFLPTPLNIKILMTQIGISRSLKEIIQTRKYMDMKQLQLFSHGP